MKWNISVAGGKENNENLYSLFVGLWKEIMNFRIPLVVASEQGTAQTQIYFGGCKVLASGALPFASQKELKI